MIFFDIDETLLDNHRAEQRAALTLHWSYVEIFPISSEEFIRNWHMVTEKYVQRYLTGKLSFQGQRRARLRALFAHARHLSDAEADAIFQGYLEAYEKNWRLFSDVKTCLERLSHCKLGIISNGDARQQRQKLAASGIFDYFSVIVISDDLGGISKPDSRIFLHACQLAKADPSQCWHIGDNLKADVYGGRMAVLNPVWLNRDRRNCRNGIVVVDSLKKLPYMIF